MASKINLIITATDVEATGRNIKKLCKENHIKVVDLAEALGISEQAIYGWFKGVKSPSYDNAKAMAEQLFHISVDKLYIMCGEQRDREEADKASSYCLQATKLMVSYFFY